jgi:phospholipase/carboxylesterase
VGNRSTDGRSTEGTAPGPHDDEPLVTGGADLAEATAAVVLVHGRGATARSILDLGREVSPDGVALLAPQAARNTWYPNSFLAPVEGNEPGRSSGLAAIDDAVATAVDAGIDRERVAVVGFSQGACLGTEYVARHPRRYGAVVALSGGLIGESVDVGSYDGSLDVTPAFLGCSDRDPHIPEERVHETADVLRTLDADVTVRIYEGMGHGVNQDEIDRVAGLVASLVE